MNKNDKTTRRLINLNGLNSELELSKVVCIKKVQKKFIYLEEMNDGTWRFTYTENVIPDIQKLNSMDIVRIDGNS